MPNANPHNELSHNSTITHNAKKVQQKRRNKTNKIEIKCYKSQRVHIVFGVFACMIIGVSPCVLHGHAKYSKVTVIFAIIIVVI